MEFIRFPRNCDNRKNDLGSEKVQSTFCNELYKVVYNFQVSAMDFKSFLATTGTWNKLGTRKVH